MSTIDPSHPTREGAPVSESAGGRPSRPTSRSRSPSRWLALAVLTLPTFLIGLDLTVLHMATPSIVTDLRPSPTAQLWIVDSYGFAVAGLLLIMGNVGDRIGRRRLLMIGAAAFASASVLAAFAPSAEMLIGARALLGTAGATLMPSTLSLIRDLFTEDGERRRAIAVWMASLLTGTAMGPLIGALMLQAFWWGAVFLLAVPVMILLLAVGPILLPAGSQGSRSPLDWRSVALFLVAVLPTVYAVKRSASYGVDLLAVGSLAFGVFAAVVFVRRQRRLAAPLLDVALFSDGRFSTATATHLGSLLSLGGMQYLFAIYLQLGLGLAPTAAGLWTLPGAILGLLGAVAAPSLAQVLPPRLLMGGALLGGAVGMGVIALASSAGPARAATGFAIVSFVVGLVTTLTTDHIIAAAPPERAGMASGITETSAELGIALGVALLGSIATAVQTRGVAEPLTAGAPPVVREAFIGGLQVSAVVAALILAVLAALTARQLRRRSLDDEGSAAR